jgi:1-acyl-sn-glycerol-3-phosphate acyltransferase
MKKNNTARKIFYWVLRHSVGPMLQWYYRIKYDKKVLRLLKPPYMVLANHTTLWDALLVAYLVPHPVFNIASDQTFRFPLLRLLLNALGVIPKKKSVSDMNAVKQLIRIKREKGVIGVFPEGKRTWDGRSVEIPFATAKLIKNLKIPVVTVHVSGGYLSRPRWASNSRRGRIEMVAKVLYTPGELEGLDLKQIDADLCNALAHDEYAWQAMNRIPFKGRRLAEKLELALFICPACRSISTLHSAGDAFTCDACGYHVRYSELGFFEKEKSEPIYTTIPQWDEWQQTQLRAHIRETGDAVLFEDNGMEKLSTGVGTSAMESHGRGLLRLFKNRVAFAKGEEEESFPLERIRGLNVQANYKLEFYCDKILYQFRHPDRGASAYKWVCAIEACLEN